MLRARELQYRNRDATDAVAIANSVSSRYPASRLGMLTGVSMYIRLAHILDACSMLREYDRVFINLSYMCNCVAHGNL